MPLEVREIDGIGTGQGTSIGYGSDRPHPRVAMRSETAGLVRSHAETWSPVTFREPGLIRPRTGSLSADGSGDLDLEVAELLGGPCEVTGHEVRRL